MDCDGVFCVFGWFCEIFWGGGGGWWVCFGGIVIVWFWVIFVSWWDGGLIFILLFFVLFFFLIFIFIFDDGDGCVGEVDVVFERLVFVLVCRFDLWFGGGGVELSEFSVGVNIFELKIGLVNDLLIVLRVLVIGGCGKLFLLVFIYFVFCSELNMMLVV